MQQIDMTGKPCPIPVLETKKILAQHGNCGAIVLVDNLIATQNLQKMAQGMGHAFSQRQLSPTCYEVTITNASQGGTATPSTPAPQTAGMPLPQVSSTSPQGNLAVLITAVDMGRGSDELGAILMKGFIFSLAELETPPAWVIFLNGGAHLTAQDSSTVPDLVRLVEKGTDIMTCGTCSNYYELGAKLAVGRIVNMYDITTTLAQADRVITL